MNNQNKGDQGEPRRKTASNSFGHLIQRALAKSPDAAKAYETLRTTYLKDEYRSVFPSSMLDPERRPIGAVDSRPRNFLFSINKESICFVRNLWFFHRFLPGPSDVVRFLTTMEPEQRREMFTQRVEELKPLASTYNGWSKAADSISEKLVNFRPTKTDLLTLSESHLSSSEGILPSSGPAGSPSAADLIREVEQRASFQAGNPEDTCEKALYFLALGSPTIAQGIAKRVLDENPDNAVALYTNAVLLLSASERHLRQAFIHDSMHPQALIPIEAEEQYHVDAYEEECNQAWEKESQAFLLVLKARRNWPARFSIKCYELAPEYWRHKVDEWLFSKAAARLATGKFSMPKQKDAEAALKMLKDFVSDISANGGGLLYFRHFIVVAALVAPDLGRDCLYKLEAILEDSKRGETTPDWDHSGMVLPASNEPTLAERLISAMTNSSFCRAIFALKPTDGAAFLQRVAKIGLANEHDGRCVMRSLVMRTVILNIVKGGGFGEAVELCREMAERRDWPATETGVKMQACWRYAVVIHLFECSRAAFEAENVRAAIAHVALALQQATDWLQTIAGEKPLLKFIEEDEYGVTEIIGDFINRLPNIITDFSMDYFPSVGSCIPSLACRQTCWNDFVNWRDAERPEKAPLLLTYGRWLSRKQGPGDLLLPKCDALAMKLASF